MVAVNEFNEIHQKLEEALEKKFGSSGEGEEDSVKLTEIFLHKKEFIFEKEDQTFAAKFSLDSKGVLMIWDGVELEKSSSPASIVRLNSAGKSDVRSLQTPPPDTSEIEAEIEEKSSPTLRGRNVEPLPEWNQAGVVQGQGSQISRPRERK